MLRRKNLLYYCIYTLHPRKKERKTNKMAFAPSEDSDQPGHPGHQSFRCPREESFGPNLPTERTIEDSDQTRRMLMLI